MPCRDNCSKCGSYDCWRSEAKCNGIPPTPEEISFRQQENEKRWQVQSVIDAMSNVKPAMYEKVFKTIKEKFNVKEFFTSQEHHNSGFDCAGALCDVMSVIEDNAPALLSKLDKTTLHWWEEHTKSEIEKLKTEALSKLSEREKRILGLK